MNYFIKLIFGISATLWPLIGNAQEVDFFNDGFFDWQFSSSDKEYLEEKFNYNEAKYWGSFPRKNDVDSVRYRLPDWCIGPFEKYEGNPVLAPSPNSWDKGRYGGGVHNGAAIVKDDTLFYIYRAEIPHVPKGYSKWYEDYIDYVCDLGIAWSIDGVNFTKDTIHSPLFRHGKDTVYSYEDVNIVRHNDTYYLFCNRWNHNLEGPERGGTFLAISKDLRNWKKHGLVFPNADRVFRNACVLHDPHNNAVKVNGKFVMYMNGFNVAYSEDLVHWEAKKVKKENHWPGGEGCLALTNYDKENPDNILFFTGGHHSGHFYAIGEVLFSKANPEKSLDWLQRPILYAEKKYPWEDGKAARKPHNKVSFFHDTVFFTGMTVFKGKWHIYYGGSEFYTCLATVEY